MIKLLPFSTALKDISQQKRGIAAGIIGILLLTGLASVLIISNLALSKNPEGQKSSEQLHTETIKTDLSQSKAIPNGYPLPFKKEPSSVYGWRIDPFNFQTKRHQGIDFSVPAGTPVKATGDGKVVQSNYDQANGQFIEIDHGDGYRTKYAHLKSPYVSPGQLIKLGQIIGEVGSTGRSTSPHLHYEVIYLGSNINPLNIMGQNISPTALVQEQDTTKTSQIKNQAANQTSANIQRVLFIRNSGTEYRMVDLSKPQQF